MIKNTDILKVREKIQSLCDKDVYITVDLGRNKKVSFGGRLTGVYPALFTIRPNEEGFKGKTSYSYSEFLCGKIKLQSPVN